MSSAADGVDADLVGRLERVVNELNSLDPAEIINRFDVEFDIPMRQSWAIHCLGLQGVYEQRGPWPNVRAKAVFVGAHWCRIVTCDVRHDYNAALESIDESSKAASELHHALKERARQHDDVDFIAYVVARWFDAVAKINFRSDDYIDAFDFFGKAFQLCETHSLDRCRADIRSNLLRAEYERDSKLVPVDRRAPEAILEDYGEAITLTRKTLEAGLSPHQREIKRGLAGLLQNQGAILNLRLEGKPAGRTDAAELEDLYRRALAAAAESQQLSEQLGDSYRVSQAIFTQGRSHVILFAKNGDRRLLKEAGRLFQLIIDGEHVGNRSKIMAKQNLARVTALDGDVETANRLFLEVLDELSESNVQGGELGFDLPAQNWTVSLIRALCQPLYADTQNRAKLRKLELEVARSGRKIVKVAKYKRDFSRIVFPLYNRLVTSTDDPDEQLALVEEVTGRELLDVLAQAE